jgi:hypothetical protein
VVDSVGRARRRTRTEPLTRIAGMIPNALYGPSVILTLQEVIQLIDAAWTQQSTPAERRKGMMLIAEAVPMYVGTDERPGRMFPAAVHQTGLLTGFCSVGNYAESKRVPASSRQPGT